MSVPVTEPVPVNEPLTEPVSVPVTVPVPCLLSGTVGGRSQTRGRGCCPGGLGGTRWSMMHWWPGSVLSLRIR